MLSSRLGLLTCAIVCALVTACAHHVPRSDTHSGPPLAPGEHQRIVNGVRLYYEEAGSGTPIVFVHEFAGDLRSWEGQVRHFGKWYQCVTFNARGYPPSDVPKSYRKYSQQIATDDIANVMRHLGVRKAHIIGCSTSGARSPTNTRARSSCRRKAATTWPGCVTT